MAHFVNLVNAVAWPLDSANSLKFAPFRIR